MCANRLTHALVVLMRDFHVCEITKFKWALTDAGPLGQALRKVWNERNITRELYLWRHYGEKLNRAFMKRCIFNSRERLLNRDHMGTHVIDESQWQNAREQLQPQEMGYELYNASHYTDNTTIVIPTTMFGGFFYNIKSTNRDICNSCIDLGYTFINCVVCRIKDIIWITVFFDTSVFDNLANDDRIQITVLANGLVITRYNCAFQPWVQFPVLDGYYGILLDGIGSAYTQWKIHCNVPIKNIIFTGHKNQHNCAYCAPHYNTMTMQCLSVYKSPKYSYEDVYGQCCLEHWNNTDEEPNIDKTVYGDSCYKIIIFADGTAGWWRTIILP